MPGVHIWQNPASTLVLAQPSGQAVHQGSLPGGTGQPAVCRSVRVSAMMIT